MSLGADQSTALTEQMVLEIQRTGFTLRGAYYLLLQHFARNQNQVAGNNVVIAAAMLLALHPQGLNRFELDYLMRNLKEEFDLMMPAFLSDHILDSVIAMLGNHLRIGIDGQLDFAHPFLQHQIWHDSCAELLRMSAQLGLAIDSSPCDDWQDLLDFNITIGADISDADVPQAPAEVKETAEKDEDLVIATFIDEIMNNQNLSEEEKINALMNRALGKDNYISNPPF